MDGFRLRIEFEDGTIKEIDLNPYLHGPIFEPIRTDLSVFRSVKVDGVTIAWDNGADIDPDVLYYGPEAGLDGKARSRLILSHLALMMMSRFRSRPA